MKRSKCLLIIHLCATSFLAFKGHAQQPKAKAEKAKEAIAQSNAIYFQAFAKGDSSLFIDRYAKDCCIMPPNVGAMCGAAAPLDFFRTAYQMGIRNGKFSTTEVFGDGKEFVTEAGLFQLFDGNMALLDSGKYLVLWKKTADGWKMFRDSFSSNLRKE